MLGGPAIWLYDSGSHCSRTAGVAVKVSFRMTFKSSLLCRSAFERFGTAFFTYNGNGKNPTFGRGAWSTTSPGFLLSFACQSQQSPGVDSLHHMLAE